MPKRYLRHRREQVVEALQVTSETVKEAAKWSGGVEVVTIDPFDSNMKFVALNVPTRDGVSRARQDDYVILDSEGQFSVMGRRAFELEHDELED